MTTSTSFFRVFFLFILISFAAEAARPSCDDVTDCDWVAMEIQEKLATRVTEMEVTAVPVKRVEGSEFRPAISARTTRSWASPKDYNYSASAIVTGTRRARAVPAFLYDDEPLRIAFVTPHNEIRFTKIPPSGESITVPVILTITPTSAVPNARLTVIAGGVGFDLNGSSQTQLATKYLPDLPQVGWIKPGVDVSSGQNGHIEVDLELDVGALNWGYLYGELEVIRDQELPEYHSTILYFASSKHRIMFSYTSLEEIAQLMTSRQPQFGPMQAQRKRERGRPTGRAGRPGCTALK